jgi:purine-binding chemotaxis protein CheW
MEITSVPQVASYVKGVINLRGKVIPVVDLRLKFVLPHAEYTDRTCIIVVEMTLRSAHALVGVVVDSVSDVVSISAEEIEGAPDLGEHDGSGCVEALAKVKGAVKIIVNLDRLFESDHVEMAVAAS